MCALSKPPPLPSLPSTVVLLLVLQPPASLLLLLLLLLLNTSRQVMMGGVLMSSRQGLQHQRWRGVQWSRGMCCWVYTVLRDLAILEGWRAIVLSYTLMHKL